MLQRKGFSEPENDPETMPRLDEGTYDIAERNDDTIAVLRGLLIEVKEVDLRSLNLEFASWMATTREARVTSVY